MSKGNTTETDFLALIFNKTLPAIWGTLATTGDAKVYIALYTADPGESGAPNNNETTYSNYVRLGVDRTAGEWTVSGNTATNVNTITFDQCGITGATLKFVGIVTSASGATGQILYSGALNADLIVSNLITPQFAPGALVIEED